jgi:hypothetical protein
VNKVNFFPGKNLFNPHLIKIKILEFNSEISWVVKFGVRLLEKIEFFESRFESESKKLEHDSKLDFFRDPLYVPNVV